MAENWKQQWAMVVGKREEGPSTPPPTWRLELNGSGDSKTPVQEFLNVPISTVSARKLCANLWEIQPHHQQTPVAKRNKPGTKLRRRRRRKDRVAEPSSNTPSDKVLSAFLT